MEVFSVPSGLEGLDSLGKCDRDYLGLLLQARLSLGTRFGK